MNELTARLPTGAQLLERFELERPLAVRETSETYLARDLQTAAPAVVRVLWLRGTASWKRVELLEREAAALSRMQHDSIPAILAFGTQTPPSADAQAAQQDVCFVLAKSYFPGETLAERAATRPLPAALTARVGAELCDVLAFLHTQSPPIVHRDVKPANVVLRDAAPTALIDFGAITDPFQSAGGGSTLVGTHGFIAPEQVVGDAGPASDLYALGATLLYAVTGREPASLPREGLRIDVAKVVGAPALARVLADLTAPDPRDRPRGAQEAARRLRAALPYLEPTPEQTLTAATTPPAASDDLDSAWVTLRGRWSDTAAHDTFIASCSAKDQLPFAGHCYKTILEATPDDAPALRGKQRVVAQAMAMLSVDNKGTHDWKRTAVVVRAMTGLVILAGCGVALWFYLTTSGARVGC